MIVAARIPAVRDSVFSNVCWMPCNGTGLPSDHVR